MVGPLNPNPNPNSRNYGHTRVTRITEHDDTNFTVCALDYVVVEDTQQQYIVSTSTLTAEPSLPASRTGTSLFRPLVRHTLIILYE